MAGPFPNLAWVEVLPWVLPWAAPEPHPRFQALARACELHDGMGADGLHTFFFLDGFGGAPTRAPRIGPALAALGLDREHALFARALALFPQPYAEDHAARADLFGYTSGGGLTAFDRRLMAVADAFGPQEALGSTIARLIAADPALEAALLAELARVPEHVLDELRFAELAALTQRLDIDPRASPAELARRFGALDEPRRTVAALVAFVLQFENGGIHQFYFNAEGALAPEVSAALARVGLAEQAALMAASLAAFGPEFPRDTQARRDRFFLGRDWNDWDSALDEVTNRFYDLPDGPGLRPALIAFAQREGLLAA